MRFTFDKWKSAQAAAFLIQRNGGPIDLFNLVKLLYLADRKSLVETGMTITGDTLVNMDLGPVVSFTYDQAKLPQEGREAEPWCQLIAARAGNKIGLNTTEPPVDHLSEYETDVLAFVFERFGKMSFPELRDFMHTLPEWHNPQGSSTRIDHAEILRAEGVSDARISEMALAAEERFYLTA